MALSAPDLVQHVVVADVRPENAGRPTKQQVSPSSRTPRRRGWPLAHRTRHSRRRTDIVGRGPDRAQSGGRRLVRSSSRFAGPLVAESTARRERLDGVGGDEVTRSISRPPTLIGETGRLHPSPSCVRYQCTCSLTDVSSWLPSGHLLVLVASRSSSKSEEWRSPQTGGPRDAFLSCNANATC
jgi:hypothetical protein